MVADLFLLRGILQVATLKPLYCVYCQDVITAVSLNLSFRSIHKRNLWPQF